MLQEIPKTKSRSLLKRARLLYEIVQQRRSLEKDERDIKELFKQSMPEGGVVEAGAYIVTVTPKSRDQLVRQLLIERFGEAAVRECERPVAYLEVGVVRPRTKPPH
jgi:hypothetical protein